MNKQITGFLIATLAAFCIIFPTYHLILLSPNSYVFNDGGDAIKNYYTYAYHILHDHSAWQFAGMNYPFGDFIGYADAQPALSIFLQWLTSIYPTIGTHAVGILNLLMILSIPVATGFVYLILLKLRLPQWYAILFSIPIALLSPQVARLAGHYGMAYSCTFPILIWITWVFLERRTIGLTILIAAFITICYFIHPYIGLIGSMFILSFLLLNKWINNKITGGLFYYVQVGIQAILPLIVFLTFNIGFDHHSKRPAEVYGSSNNSYPYATSVKNLILSPAGTLHNLSPSFSVGFEEGTVYLGIVSILVFLLYLIRLFLKWRAKRQFNLKIWRYWNTVSILWLSGFIILCFAMAIPYKLTFGYLLDLLSPLKQFRSMGRFSWLFYYCFSAYTACVVYVIYKKQLFKGRKYIAYLTVALVAIIWYTESISYQYQFWDKEHLPANPFTEQGIHPALNTAITNIDTNLFQAIVPLPFFYVGAEKIDYPASNTALKLAQTLSMRTGLPILASHMSRAAIQDAAMVCSFVEANNKELRKQLFNTMASNKDFLILYTGEALSTEQNLILTEADTIAQANEITLLKISYEKAANLF